MKKIKKKPRSKKLLLLLLLIVVSVTVYTITSTRSVTKQTEKIIDRAKQLVRHVPNDSLRSMFTTALSLMEVYDATNIGDEKVDITLTTPFILVIYPAQRDINSASTTLMAFDDTYWRETGRIQIRMNAAMFDVSEDIDALASVLLHEIVHALQLNWGDTKPYMEQEREAWAFQRDIYFAANPKAAHIRYDCNTSKVPGVDDLVGSIILFNYCTDTFMRVHYSKN